MHTTTATLKKKRDMTWTNLYWLMTKFHMIPLYNPHISQQIRVLVTAHAFLLNPIFLSVTYNLHLLTTPNFHCPISLTQKNNQSAVALVAKLLTSMTKKPDRFLKFSRQKNTRRWFQPIWKLLVKLDFCPQSRGENSKHIWVATTQNFPRKLFGPSNKTSGCNVLRNKSFFSSKGAKPSTIARLQRPSTKEVVL